jgi:Tol biopolymer transport system component
MVAYRSERDGGGVYVIPALGGDARLVGKGGRDPRFSPDGQRIAYWEGDPRAAMGAQVWVAPANGGEPERLGGDFGDARYPLWSPDGTRVVVVGSYRNRGDWFLIPFDGSAPAATGAYQILDLQGFSRDVMARGALAAPSVWERGGFLFSGVSGDTANLWRAPFSPSIGQVTGSAERVTFGTGWESQPSESANGRIVFSSSTMNLDIWSVPLHTDTGKVHGELKRIVEGAARDYQPSLSQDGTRLVYRSDRNGRECIWVKDLTSGKEVEHCGERLRGTPAYLSPGGARILYTADRGTHVMKTDGSEDKTVCRGCRPLAWLPDENRFLFQYRDRRLSVKGIGEDEGREVLRSEEFGIAEPRPSPDGKWIAFHVTKRPVGMQVFVAPFRDSEPVREKDWIAITGDSSNDRSAHWSPDGSLLYFLSDRDGHRCVWAQRLDSRTKLPRGEPFGVQHFHHARLSLMNGREPGDVGLSVAKDRLVVSVFEMTGNIWMLGGRR